MNIPSPKNTGYKRIYKKRANATWRLSTIFYSDFFTHIYYSAFMLLYLAK